MLAVGSAGILPAEESSTRRDARSPHRQDACVTSWALLLGVRQW
jgi:hypothetical protein